MQMQERILTTAGLSYNLSGAVRHQGLPVAGVTVMLFEYWRVSTGVVRQFLARAKTGARGEFTFDCPAGTYHLELIPDSSTRFLRQSVEDLRVTGNTVCNVNLKTGLILTGAVRSHDRQVLADCRVIAQGIEPSAYRTAERPGPSGEYTLVLPRGRFCLAVRYESQPGGSSEKPFINPEVAVIDVDGDRRHDIDLPEFSTLSGCVSAGDGRPVSGAAVSVTPAMNEDNVLLADLRIKAVALTGAGGRYEILARPGEYDILVQGPGEAKLAEHRERGIAVDGTRRQDVLLLPGFRLKGQVAYRGRPVKGCLVRAHGADPRASVTSTGADGEYAIGLTPGHYEVSVSGTADASGRHTNASLAPFIRDIELDGDLELDIELSEGIAVSGTVVDGEGKPRPGVRVIAVAHDGGPAVVNEGDRPVASATTCDDGSYSFSLVDGQYLVYLGEDAGNVRRVEVNSQPLTVDFTWTAGHLIVFTVVSEDDEPVPRCKVVFEPYAASGGPVKGRKGEVKSGTVTGFAHTGEDGACRITLPAGVYSFKFMPPAQGSYQTRAIRQLSVGGDMKRAVRLSLKRVSPDREPSAESENALTETCQPSVQLRIKVPED